MIDPDDEEMFDEVMEEAEEILFKISTALDGHNQSAVLGAMGLLIAFMLKDEDQPDLDLSISVVAAMAKHILGDDEWVQ